MGGSNMPKISRAAIAERERRAAGAARVAKSRKRRTGWRRVEVWVPDKLADMLLGRYKAGVVIYTDSKSTGVPTLVEISTKVPMLRFHFADRKTTIFKMVRIQDLEWDSSC